MENENTEATLRIGEKIRLLREGACLTPEQLAQRAGIETEELVRIEKDMFSPALGILMRICDGLGVRLGHFFDQGPRKMYSLVRAADGKSSTRFASKSGMDFGQQYYSLGSEKRERVMEPFLITMKAPSDASGNPIEMEQYTSHPGEEFLYVLEGKIQIQIEDQIFILAPGDSIYYDSNVRHRICHHGPGQSRILAVIYRPRPA